ncbi:MAG TPA: HAD family hydrolase [Thermoplasmata archaeon]|nr:HAD family hydrolase [Thermoplasmata archaeon]
MPPAGRSRESGATAWPRAVLFDMDDTIFDHTLTCRAALVALRRERAFLRRVALDEQLRTYGSLLATTHVPVMLGRRTSDDARRDRFRAIAAQAGRPVGPGEAEALSRAYRAHYQRLRRPVPGAIGLVRALHRVSRIGVVTNNTVAEQTEKLSFLGIRSLVDVLVTSEEIGAAKPDPRIYAAALRRTGAAAGEAVMIGDSWSSDVDGARTAGIRPIWFNRFRIPRPRADPVDEVRSFEPSRKVLEMLRIGPRPTAVGRRGVRPLHIGRGG